jgi:hypothetical protein
VINACDVYPVSSVIKSEVVVDSVGRDVRSTLKSGDWVELLDDILILQGKPGQFLQVSDVSSQDRRVTHVSNSAFDIDPKIAIIRAHFQPPVNSYRTGDYWLIPARTALQGSIEWPATSDNPSVPIALPPHGIDHHYLPLGVVTLANATSCQLGVTSQFISPINPIT